MLTTGTATLDPRDGELQGAGGARPRAHGRAGDAARAHPLHDTGAAATWCGRRSRCGAEGGPFRILPALARGPARWWRASLARVLAAGAGLLLVTCAAIPFDAGGGQAREPRRARRPRVRGPAAARLAVRPRGGPAGPAGGRRRAGRADPDGEPCRPSSTRCAARGQLRAVLAPTSLVPSRGAAAHPRPGAGAPRPGRSGHRAGAGGGRDRPRPVGLRALSPPGCAGGARAACPSSRSRARAGRCRPVCWTPASASWGPVDTSGPSLSTSADPSATASLPAATLAPVAREGRPVRGLLLRPGRGRPARRASSATAGGRPWRPWSA